MRCPTPINIKDPRYEGGNRTITVPCSRCGACRHNRRADWSFRLQEELRVSETAYFITLTYNDECLPYAGLWPTLVKRDLQLFHKSVRKANKGWSSAQYRYYAVGEYGPKTQRPHYHIIAYNLNKYVVDRIDKYWEYGNFHVGSVTPSSMHYVAKYHVNSYKEDGIREPEFATMSRRPGLGVSYISRAFQWHRENENWYLINQGYKQRLPRYYNERLFTDLERRVKSIKDVSERDEEYWREYDRLVRLFIHNPDAYMQESMVQEAKKVQKKSEEKGIF